MSDVEVASKLVISNESVPVADAKSKCVEVMSDFSKMFLL